MIRDINVKKEVDNLSENQEDDFEIPMPSSCLLEMGVSITGFKTPSPFSIEEKVGDEFEDQQFIPSLTDICINLMSQQIVIHFSTH